MKTNLKFTAALAAILLTVGLAPAQAQNAPESNKVRLKMIKEVNGQTTVVDTTFEKGSPEFDAYLKKLEETRPNLKDLNLSESRQFKVITDVKDGKETERQVFVFDTLKAVQIRSMDQGALPPHIREQMLQNPRPIRIEVDEKGDPKIQQFRQAIPPAELDKMLKENGVEGKRIFISCDKLPEGQMPRMLMADSLLGKLSADEMTVFKRVETDGKTMVFIRIMKVEKEETALLENQNTNLETPKKELKVEDFSVYPNPTVGRFNLSFEIEDKGTTAIRIFDEAGRQVYTEELRSFKGAYNKEIDLSGSPKGVYFVRVDQGKKGFSRKIVLQ